MDPDPISLQEIPDEITDFAGTIKSIKFPRQGYTSDVGIIESDRGRFVIKRSIGEQYCSWLSQEVNTLRGLLNTKLPVPQIYRAVELEEKNQVWALMHFFEGETLRHALRNEHNTDRRHQLIFNFGNTLATIHSTPCPGELIGDTVWLDAMISRAEYNLKHYKVDGTAELLHFLKTNRPVSIKNTLIHGDFTIDNVLVSGEKITGIIDWSGGGFGDPRYDLSLAIRPKPNAFETKSDLDVFFDGYGTRILNEQEYRYFKEGLNEFF